MKKEYLCFGFILFLVACQSDQSYPGKYRMNSINGDSTLYLNILAIEDSDEFEVQELDVGDVVRRDRVHLNEEGFLRGLILMPKGQLGKRSATTVHGRQVEVDLVDEPLEMLLQFQRKKLVQIYEYNGEVLFRRYFTRVN